MVSWEIVGPDNWDAWLSEFEDKHVRQTTAWARYKAGGWTPVYTALLNDGAPLAMGLLLQRCGVVWLNGGPVYKKRRPAGIDLSSLAKYVEGLQRRFGLVRLSSAAPMDLEAQLILRQRGFQRPLVPLDTGLTYVVDLTKSLDELRDGLERRWRAQLKRALEARPKAEFGRSPELRRRYAALHEALVRRKKVAGVDADAMAEALGERVEFAVLSVDGVDGCGGAVWTLGDRAWFGLSAANEKGLELDLPNAFYWLLIERLKAAGFKTFDVTGIDPRRNWGVFNFKRGLGLPPVEQLGEWEWAGSDWKRRAFNLALWLRGGL